MLYNIAYYVICYQTSASGTSDGDTPAYLSRFVSRVSVEITNEALMMRVMEHMNPPISACDRSTYKCLMDVVFVVLIRLLSRYEEVLHFFMFLS